MQSQTNKQTIPQTRKIILSALFLASSIVLSRFLAIRTPIIAINFAFVPLMLSGMLLGWRYSTFIAIIADLIGAILFPSGSFFIGYTLTAALKGFVVGVLLYRSEAIQLDKNFIVRLIICSFIICFALNGVLNTVWIAITSGGASNVIVPIRLIKQLIMLPIQVLTISALVRIFTDQFELLRVSAPIYVTDEEDGFND